MLFVTSGPKISQHTETMTVTKVEESSGSEEMPSQSPPSIQPPPDTGLVAWSQAVLGHMVAINTWGYMASFGIFQTYYQTSLGVSPSSISWVGSTQVFLIFFVGTFSGRALDAGFFRPVFFSGVFLQLVGVFMTSLSTKYWQLFLAQGVCTGVGNGLMWTPVMGLVATYFEKRRVFALAFCLIGSGTGGMFFPGLVRALLPRIGLPWTIRVLGFVMLAFVTPAMIFLRTRIPPRKSGPLIEWSAFRDPVYTLFCVGMFLSFWGPYFAFYYVGAFGHNVIGLTYEDSLNLIIAMNGAGVVGRLFPALLADAYFGPMNTIIPLAMAGGIVMYCWAAVHSVGGLYIFAILYGFCSNGVQGLWPSTLASLTTDLDKMGIRIGMGFTIVSFACLSGPPLGGGLIVHSHSYLGAQMWAGSVFLLGAIILVMSRIARTGMSIKAKI
ncbi:Riboflavin transporter MCH5 [Talaromyces islandicus]|uniref:Riboflavin transporter MCH5 n=1 Tax=Talaromyces islandicus TaxID=28573 RepID=A0A0U1MA48_TALIS|nr:Riboflavin transporter MCH5 [Talaromyces islandicus]